MKDTDETPAEVKKRILKIAGLNLLIPGIGNVFLDSPRPLNIVGFMLGIWATLHGWGVWLTVSAIMTFKAYIDVWMEPQHARRQIADTATPKFGSQASSPSAQLHTVSDTVPHATSHHEPSGHQQLHNDPDHLLRDKGLADADSGTAHTGSAHSGSAHAQSAHQESTHSQSTYSGSTHSGSAHSGSTHSGSAYSDSTHSGSAHTSELGHKDPAHMDPADAYFEQALPVAHVNHPSWRAQNSAHSEDEHLSHGAPQSLNVPHSEHEHRVRVGMNKAAEQNSHLSHGTAQSLADFTSHQNETHPQEHLEHPHLINANRPIDEMLHEEVRPHSEHLPSSSEEGEFGTSYDIYDDSSQQTTGASTSTQSSEPSQTSVNSPLAAQASDAVHHDHLLPIDQIGMTAAPPSHKKSELCPTCQRPREGNRPKCPACGTHFDTDSDW